MTDIQQKLSQTIRVNSKRYHIANISQIKPRKDSYPELDEIDKLNLDKIHVAIGSETIFNT